MAASLRKIGYFLGLSEEREVFAEEVVQAPRSTYTRERRNERTAEPNSERPVLSLADRRAEVSPPLPAPVSAAAMNPTIVMANPHSFNDAKEIGEELRRGHAVVMNLQECDEALARRLVDYASGLIHGIDGKLSRITRGVFVISPSTVDVSEQLRSQIETDGFFN